VAAPRAKPFFPVPPLPPLTRPALEAFYKISGQPECGGGRFPAGGFSPFKIQNLSRKSTAAKDPIAETDKVSFKAA